MKFFSRLRSKKETKTTETAGTTETKIETAETAKTTETKTCCCDVDARPTRHLNEIFFSVWRNKFLKTHIRRQRFQGVEIRKKISYLKKNVESFRNLLLDCEMNSYVTIEISNSEDIDQYKQFKDRDIITKIIWLHCQPIPPNLLTDNVKMLTLYNIKDFGCYSIPNTVDKILKQTFLD
ncbi:hypothetical protein CYY_000123 [Polysphondylium violaceum]|uniref:Uncharacterized protein n=1 Tax=Polysphondylium violaceum TaxID=133409 RepID=A0A8J4Q299_9MYCE|nr:hypothetical protein CYY_000123 [Polysphondylium violaceum]